MARIPHSGSLLLVLAVICIIAPLLSGAYAQSPIKLNGNPTIWRSVDLVYIWFGNGWSNQTMDDVKYFGQNLDTSSLFNVTRLYGAVGKAGYNTSMHVRLSFVTRIGPGSVTSLNQTSAQAIVTKLIQNKQVPWYPMTGVYVLLTAANIAVDTHCTSTCAYHTTVATTVNAVTSTVPMVVMPSTASCWPGCTMYTGQNDATSPNNNPESDSMLNHLAHEISETITDPYCSGGWYDDDGQEDADKCAWNFGTAVQKTNGKNWNTVIGRRQYLLQLIWNPLPSSKAANATQIGCVGSTSATATVGTSNAAAVKEVAERAATVRKRMKRSGRRL